MLLQLLFDGQVITFVMIIAALVLSLSFHEFGHAWAAKMYGDDTAQRLGRLTVNPISHIDPVGLLMVVMVGFGYAKPVPFNVNNTKSVWAQAGVAIAGPVANLLIAIVALNVYILGVKSGWGFTNVSGSREFFQILIQVNIFLMLFNLIPIGVLDGHWILPYFLPKNLATKYRELNDQYGMYALMGLLLLSFAGLPVLGFLQKIAYWLIPHLSFVG